MQFKCLEDVANLISSDGEATINVEKGIKRLELQAKSSKSRSWHPKKYRLVGVTA